jgi:hypothetical protein
MWIERGGRENHLMEQQWESCDYPVLVLDLSQRERLLGIIAIALQSSINGAPALFPEPEQSATAEAVLDALAGRARRRGQ